MFKFKSLSVWQNSDVRQRLGWYYNVMRNKRPAKFMICKSIPCAIDIKTASTEELWLEHERLCDIFRREYEYVKSNSFSSLKYKETNFLDLKAEIAKRVLDKCNLCEWNCKVNRNQGKVGVCRLDKTTRVSSWFRHFGEEPPLVNIHGSGTIFFTGCMFRCVFCQNWTISQYPLVGEEVDGRGLELIMKELWRDGAHNINFVGGEPTPNIHTIIDGMRHLDVNIPMLWNSDMYASIDAMNLLNEVIDIWLPDFKYGNDECARRLSNVPNYFAVASRNHKIAYENGDMIIRHLVLPNHFNCCTKPVLEWIAQNCPRSLVNVMDQYYPDYRVAKNPERYPDIARRLTHKEIEQAFAYAKKLGLVYEPVSR
ncbi:MAG: radical SAM protein [Nitrososphaerales archaeon]